MKKQPIDHSAVYYSIPFKGGQWPTDYYPIAHVNSENLNEVFKLTQNGIELSESELHLVHWFHPTRSMMIGDVVVNRNGTFLCESTDWQKI